MINPILSVTFNPDYTGIKGEHHLSLLIPEPEESLASLLNRYNYYCVLDGKIVFVNTENIEWFDQGWQSLQDFLIYWINNYSHEGDQVILDSSPIALPSRQYV